MGKSSSAVTGYHYKPAFHQGLGRGPIDAYLEWRVADKTAWSGELTQSGAVTVAAPFLFGGPKDQGGVEGTLQLMFGEADQTPNSYLASAFGPQQPAWRGLVTLVWQGGRFGANNPYAQKNSSKLRKILQGWDGGECWYPEKAEIELGEAGVPLLEQMQGPLGKPATVIAWAPNDAYVAFGGYGDHLKIFRRVEDTFVECSVTHPLTDKPSGLAWSPDGTRLLVTSDAYDDPFVLGRSGHTFTVAFSMDCAFVPGGAQPRGCTWAPDGSHIAVHFARDSAGPEDFHYIARFTPSGARIEPGDVDLAGDPNHWHCAEHRDDTVLVALDVAPGIRRFTVGGSSYTDTSGNLPALSAGTHQPRRGPEGLIAFSKGGESAGWGLIEEGELVAGLPNAESGAEAVTWSPVRTAVMVGGRLFSRDSEGAWSLLAEIPQVNTRAVEFSRTGRYVAATHGNSDVTASNGVYIHAGFSSRGLVAMNPAHVLVYSRTDSERGREPLANINEASLVAAADRLYAEGFGICTEYDPASESPAEFESRICMVIGGSFERSLTNGQWYLDLARSDYDIDALPILGDDDVLDYKEQSSTLDRAVNSVSVRYFDPERKETVITPAVRALGLVRKFGEIHETLDFPEIPDARLAARVAERELRAKVTPQAGFNLVTTPKSYAWRRGTYFRLQAPKRGIADMVCIVGQKKRGTLKSGAIDMTVVQDVYNLPEASYVEIEPGVDPPTAEPELIELQRADEAPYCQLASRLPRAELELLPADAGFVMGTASAPTAGRDFTMVVTANGAPTVEADTGFWCPTATVPAAMPSAIGPTLVALQYAYRLNDVDVGAPAWWDEELVRVEAVNVGLGTVTLGRGCGDTVPAAHAAGSRVWFFDQCAAADPTEYAEGEALAVKLLTNMGAARLDASLATEMTVQIEGRASRPYPPGNVVVDGAAFPAAVDGEFTVTWAHRDRLLQADQLVDHAAASIGPEPTTRYLLRFLDSDDAVLIQRNDIAGATAAVRLDYDGEVVMELASISDNGESWQTHRRTFEYTRPLGEHLSLITAPTYQPTTILVDGGEVTP